MSYDTTIKLLKIFVTAIFDPKSISNNFRKDAALKYPKSLKSNNNNNNTHPNSANYNAYTKPDKGSNINNNKGIPLKDNKPYNDSNDHNNEGNIYNKQKSISLDSQGVIDSIAKDLTPVRLQQAIILSEIIGKPRSKTRIKRRF